MKMLKPDPSFEEKIICFLGGEPEQAFVDALNNLVRSYYTRGRSDATKGKTPAKDKCFVFLGKLVHPDDEDADMADAFSAYMKRCYMDGYEAGRSAI